MRKVISAMQISVDGYIEDPEGKQDWVDNWEDDYGLMEKVDVCVLGGVMYPGYEAYWTSALERPREKLPFSEKVPTPREVAYAQWAAQTPHIVVSRHPLEVAWKNTRVVSDLEEIRKLKEEQGKSIYVVGGATVVSLLINRGVIDEIRLIINPVLLGGGKLLFSGVTDRHWLKLRSAERSGGGNPYLVYTVEN